MTQKRWHFIFNYTRRTVMAAASSDAWPMLMPQIWLRMRTKWQFIGSTICKRNSQSKLNGLKLIGSNIIDVITNICLFPQQRRDFENALGLVKWPHINVSTDSLSGSSESLLKLVLAAEYLFLVSIKSSLYNKSIKSIMKSCTCIDKVTRGDTRFIRQYYVICSLSTIVDTY